MIETFLNFIFSWLPPQWVGIISFGLILLTCGSIVKEFKTIRESLGKIYNLLGLLIVFLIMLCAALFAPTDKQEGSHSQNELDPIWQRTLPLLL